MSPVIVIFCLSFDECLLNTYQLKLPTIAEHIMESPLPKHTGLIQIAHSFDI